MSMKILLGLCFLAVLVQLSLTERTCPKGTFACDGGCIPSEWVCDETNDCQNGLDEQNCEYSKSATTDSASNTNAASTTESATTSQESATEAASTAQAASTTQAATTTEAQTADSTAAAAATTTASSSDAEDSTDSTDIPIDYYNGGGWGAQDPFPEINIPRCSESNKTKVDGCYNYIGPWIEKVGAINPDINFFTSDYQLQATVEACTAFKDFKNCMGDIWDDPGPCAPQEAIDNWEFFDSYVCQLLLPTANASTYDECFEKVDSHDCSLYHFNISTPHNLGNYCNPIVATTRVLDCIEFVSDECSEDSQLMIAAISRETAAVDQQYRCTANIAQLIGNTECPSAVDLQPCMQIIGGQNFQLSIYNIQQDELQGLCNTFAEFKACMSEKILRNECWPQDAGLSFLNAVFGVACQDDNLQGIGDYSSCFQSVTQDSRLTDCTAEAQSAVIDPTNACSHMNSFVAYLTCSKSIVEELCIEEAYAYIESLEGQYTDEVIGMRCGGEPEEASSNVFMLRPLNPECTEDQDTNGLGCLIELLELQDVFGDFGTQNIILELSDPESSLIQKTCSIYKGYDDCVRDAVFLTSNPPGQRCSFKAAINKVARIGIAPICDPTAQANLQQYNWCIKKLADNPGLETCTRTFATLGNLIMSLVTGGNDITLCRVFYMIRDIFDCIEPLVVDTCGYEPLGAINRVKLGMTDLAVEEGCPAIRPENWNELVASTLPKPKEPKTGTKSLPPPSLPSSNGLPSGPPPGGFPPGGPPPGGPPPGGPPPGGPPPSVSTDEEESSDGCNATNRNVFNQCIAGLVAYKPNPLSVIDIPRNIDLACDAYSDYITCREVTTCRPLWAEGVNAMFEYTCNDGIDLYKSQRRCLKRVSARTDIRKCSTRFSQEANVGDSCEVANTFINCVYTTVKEKCGDDGAEFVLNFISSFAEGVDEDCEVKLNGETNVQTILEVTGAITGELITTVNCSSDQEEIINQCKEPLQAVVLRLEGLFTGGIGKFLQNMNQLGGIFSQGCDASEEFKECVEDTVEDSDCSLGSCLMKAGEGVCEEEDREEAIKGHLNCVFGLLAKPKFGLCIRQTFAGGNVATLTLEALKELIPEFVTCAQDVIEENCGATPVNILKSLSSDGSQCIVEIGDSSDSTAETSSTAESDGTTESTETGDDTTAEPETAAESTAEPSAESTAASSGLETTAESSDSESTAESSDSESTAESSGSETTAASTDSDSTAESSDSETTDESSSEDTNTAEPSAEAEASATTAQSTDGEDSGTAESSDSESGTAESSDTESGTVEGSDSDGSDTQDDTTTAATVQKTTPAKKPRPAPDGGLPGEQSQRKTANSDRTISIISLLCGFLLISLINSGVEIRW